MHPAWATNTKRYVPVQLIPSESQSSFAPRDEASSFRRASLSGSTGTGGSVGSSFGAPKTLGSRRPAAGADLPPTESIHIQRPHEEPRRLPDSLANSFSFSNTSARSTAAKGDGSYPVVVFGFPPGYAQQIAQHFAQFGDIAEKSHHSGDTSTTRRPQNIECGRNWLRLTYQDQAAADRAVSENGRSWPGGFFVIGCVHADGADMAAEEKLSSLLADESEVSVEIPQNILDEVRPAASAASEKTDSSTSKSHTAGSTSTTGSTGSTGSTGATSSAGSASTPVPKIHVHQPTASLFKSPQKATPSPSPVKHHQPDGWAGWAAQLVRQTVFGWDDL